MNVTELISRSQRGGSEGKMAANQLLLHISEKYLRQKLKRFFRSGMPYDDRDELRQVFLIGCYKGILEVELNIGDPLAFILNKGLWAARDEIRRKCRERLLQVCKECFVYTKPNRFLGQYQCPQCKSNNVELRSNTISIHKVFELQGVNQDSSLTLNEFRDRLTGRKRDVFDLIVIEGYDRTSCKNYLQSVARILGVTQSNVNLRLRAIRKAWIQYELQT